jgi:hypothetical protein
MLKRSSIVVTSAALAVYLVGGVASSAHTWRRSEHVTFSGVVALPGVTLPTGTYVFEIVDPTVSIDVVRVRSVDRTKVYFTGFTELVSRPVGWPLNRPISLAESLRGVPPQVVAWYPTGDAIGRRFLYNRQ